MSARSDPPAGGAPGGNLPHLRSWAASAPNDDVLRAIAVGDADEAVRAMVVQHQKQIVRLCLFILGKNKEAVAEEMAQETFLAAFEGLQAAFDGQGGRQVPNNYETWLKAIAVNKCRGWFRKMYREGRFFVLDLDVEHTPGSDGAEIELYVETRLLAFCVNQLPPDRQELFMQWHFDGMPLKQLAAQRGTKEPAASRLLGRMFEKVRECVLGKAKGGDS